MKRTLRRYLSFRLHSDDTSVDAKQLGTAIWKNLLSIYGEVSAADSKLYLVQYDEETGDGILQCTLAALDRVITSAVLIGSIGKSSVSFEPKKTSGTVRSLKK